MPFYPKNLVVSGDYSSSGIWTRKAAGLLQGRMLLHEELALPEELAVRFTEWLTRHDLHGRKSGFDASTFDAMGLALSRDLQALLGPLTRVAYTPFGTAHQGIGRSLLRSIHSLFRRRP